MSLYLYEKVKCVPDISPKQIKEMRHILPVLNCGNMFREISGSREIDPVNSSFLWDAKPEGEEFTFSQPNMTTVITQHYSSVFFKPSLAEVYAWILVYMPRDWNCVTNFCLGEPSRIGGSSNCSCNCILMGGERLYKGSEIVFADGGKGHTLVKKPMKELVDLVNESSK